MARAVADRAAAVRRNADSAVRKSRARGNRRRAAAALGPAARRGGDGALHARRNDVHVLIQRAVTLQGRRHARALPGDEHSSVSAARSKSRGSRQRTLTRVPFVSFFLSDPAMCAYFLSQSPTRLPAYFIVIS